MCPWPCSQTPTYDIPATSGKQAIAGMFASGIPAATGTQGTQAGEATTSVAKTLVAAGSVNKSGRKYRNIAENVAVINKKFGGREMPPSGRGFCQEWQ